MTKKEELRRVNFNIPSSLYDKVKNYADSLGLPMTYAYIVLLNSAMEQKDALSQMPTLIEMVSEKMKKDKE